MRHSFSAKPSRALVSARLRGGARLCLRPERSVICSLQLSWSASSGCVSRTLCDFPPAFPPMRPLSFFLAAALLLNASARGDTSKVTYVDNVLPIFRNACLNCHNPDKKKAGLDLTTYGGTIAGSENGKV